MRPAPTSEMVPIPALKAITFDFWMRITRRSAPSAGSWSGFAAITGKTPPYPAPLRALLVWFVSSLGRVERAVRGARHGATRIPLAYTQSALYKSILHARCWEACNEALACDGRCGGGDGGVPDRGRGGQWLWGVDPPGAVRNSGRSGRWKLR